MWAFSYADKKDAIRNFVVDDILLEDISEDDLEIYISKATIAIDFYGQNHTNRQRNYIYAYMERYLHITFNRKAYDYEDKRKDPAKIALETDIKEYAWLGYRIVRALFEKENGIPS